MSNETLIDTPLKVGDAEPIPEDLSATLRVVAGPDTGTLIGVDEAITLIGRDDDCQLKLDDPRVSGHHAMVYFASGEFRVRDMSSTNGSLLNGSPLTEFAFQDGDDLRVGKTVVRLVVDFRSP